MSAPDPFALGGVQNDDAEILALFRQWLADGRIADATEDGDPAEWDAALSRRDAIEDRIIAGATGPLGLAVKAFLLCKIEFQDWAPSINDLRIDDLFEENPGYVLKLIASLLRTAAGIVPEIAECAAAVVHSDAELIDAAMDVGWCDLMLAKYPDDDRQPEVLARLNRALTRIRETAATSARGEAIKAQHAARS